MSRNAPTSADGNGGRSPNFRKWMPALSILLDDFARSVAGAA